MAGTVVMNDRERFQAAMHYHARDRSPICDFGYWPETLVVWHGQGLPEEISEDGERYFHDFFGTDFSIRRASSLTGIDVGLMPCFQEEVLENRGDCEVAQQEDGVRVLRKKFMGSIPKPLSHLLVDRDSWRKHYKPRLDPTHPDRYSENWEEQVKSWTDPRRDHPLILPGGSLYGWLRNWMGLEKLSYVVYDNPGLFEEIAMRFIPRKDTR